MHIDERHPEPSPAFQVREDLLEASAACLRMAAAILRDLVETVAIEDDRDADPYVPGLTEASLDRPARPAPDSTRTPFFIG